MCPRSRVLVVEKRIFLLPPRKPERSVTPGAPQQQRTIFEFVFSFYLHYTRKSLVKFRIKQHRSFCSSHPAQYPTYFTVFKTSSKGFFFIGKKNVHFRVHKSTISFVFSFCRKIWTFYKRWAGRGLWRYFNVKVTI